MSRVASTLLAAAVATATAGCDRGDVPPRPPPEPPPPPSARLRLAAEVWGLMDHAVDPCEDFYAYACGGWLARTRRPADRPRYGRGFGQLIDRNSAVVRAILEASLAAPEGPEGQILGEFYRACMDEGRRSDDRVAAVLAAIAKVKDRRGLLAFLAGGHATVWSGEQSPLFAARVEPDPKRPSVYVLTLAPAGLGLPDRDYYLSDDPASVEVRRFYQDHVAAALQRLGDPPAEARAYAAAIVAFERRLASLHRPRAALRDPEAIYHRLGEAGLSRASRLEWRDYFAALRPHLGEVGPHLNVTVPEYFAGLPAALASLDPPALRAYLRWHFIHAAAPYLGPAEVAADLELKAALTGQAALPPRWQRCVDLAVDGPLGELLGPAFVARTVTPAGQDLARGMVEAVQRAFAGALARVEWMEAATRERALIKLRAIANRISQPEGPSPLVAALSPARPDRGLLEHVLDLHAAAFRRHAGGLGGPVDRGEWEMTAPTVNAYYSPTFNEMIFPAGILQPPYFSVDYPMAMNFGGLGMVIGHELVHGFDDEGRRYDADGALREWWDPGTLARFEARTSCVERAYSRVEVLPGVRLDGRLTLGENIADLGGLRTAHTAYREWARERGEEPRLLAGLSGDQLLFVAFAQGWCTLSSAEVARLDATVDPHAPPRQRVNVSLSHLPAFWEAFQCGPGTPMRAAEVCEVW